MYFLIRTSEVESRIIKLWGHLIRLEKYGTFIVDHRHNMADPNERYIGYVLTEPKSGMRVSDAASSIREAIEKLVTRLDKPTEAKRFRSKLERFIKEHGILNEVES